MIISLCMIVRNEEATLSRCLESAKQIADEIVIVDTGSTDATMQIAARYTNQIFTLPWRNNFAYARNFAFSKATGEYLMWLDADDVLSEDALACIPALRERLEKESPDLLSCPYRSGEMLYYRERFFKRSANFQWVGRVHECIAPRGKVMQEPKFEVVHLPGKREHGSRNLDIYRQWAQEEALSPRDLFYYGRELYYQKLYLEGIAVLEEMLRGKGWYVNQIEACDVLSRCHEARGDADRAKEILLKSFLYGEPRARILCRLGEMCNRGGQMREAVFYYEAALLCRDHSAEGDFEVPACRSLVPLLALTSLYFRLGEKEKSLLCHRKTVSLFPDHPSVLFNRRFFGE